MALTGDAGEAFEALVRDAEPFGESAFAELSTVVVIAPHADDESLGCGGLVALLARAGQMVWIVLVSDGTLSHPGSKSFDAEARRELREREVVSAAGYLGVPPERVLPMRLPDGALPGPADPRFEETADVLRAIVETTGASTLLVPWRRDPHPDHRAASALSRHAIEKMAVAPPRLLEYLVWTSERAEAGDLPVPAEARAWRVDIRSVQEQKRRAIAAHASQAGLVITDDPDGFTIPTDMRERAAGAHEIYFETA